MGLFEELRKIICDINIKSKNVGKTPEEEDFNDSVETVDDVLTSFSGPLHKIPENLSEVLEIYGRAPKDDNPANKKWSKAKMMTAKNLPGVWNSGSGRLYTLAFMEPYLREALDRCTRLGVLDYIEKLGCYNHRHIRHDSAKPLSYHSWGCAVDINPKSNKALLRKTKQLAPAFSKQYLEVYPDHMPLDLVLAFKSVGFAWGGDWGRGDWERSIRNKGVGWDASSKSDWPDDWKKITYYDPMHFELIKR